MKYELKDVVPWGRNLDEYTAMFDLTTQDLNSRILGIGDGPASFNAEQYQKKRRVISLDPLYSETLSDLTRRIEESRRTVIELTRQHLGNFTWKKIKNVEELESVRMATMHKFLADFETGREDGRYIPHTMPAPVPFPAASFDIGLSSHFLLLYVDLGLDFHIRTIREMLRVCREVRIFPILDLDAQKSALLPEVIKKFSPEYRTEIIQVDYEFQKGGNEMLRISHKN